DPGDLAVVAVHRTVQHVVEGRAQAVAPTAAVAELGDPSQLLLRRGGIEVVGVADVVGHRPVGRGYSSLSPSRPFVKRPAWLRSALARVSNHSAISGKPSSRAVLAMPGYIWVYSYVSPSMADCRFCFVFPKETPVTGSPTLFRKSMWPKAWPVSASEASRKTPPIAG